MGNSPLYTWKPTDVIEVTNTSGENFLLKLDSGLLRLDTGRMLRLTASALEQPQVMALANIGKLKVKPFHWRQRR
jgi:hypothetical protein